MKVKKIFYRTLQERSLISMFFRIFEEIIFLRALHCQKENVSLHCPTGEMVGHQESVFCFILLSKSPISSKGVETM